MYSKCTASDIIFFLGQDIDFSYCSSSDKHGNFDPFLAQLISCAITNHSSGRDCCCQCQWHRHQWRQHCRQKLTSSSVPI